MANSTRDIIVAAAFELFQEHGYDNASMKAIAEQAGLATSHSYFYFASKEDLLVAVIDRALLDCHEIIVKMSDDSNDLEPGDFLDNCFEAFASIRRQATFIIHCALTPKLAERINQQYQEFHADLNMIFLKYFEGAGTTAQIAADALSALVYSYFLKSDEDQVKEAFFDVLYFYWDESFGSNLGKHIKMEKN
ncbi:MAG: TetR/AcrR family transcriptional regulator [Coriobacteriia bacterium]|nr:TetR/AcrR family transcriptional regulator [Coriobacteriia bacterium]